MSHPRASVAASFLAFALLTLAGCGGGGSGSSSSSVRTADVQFSLDWAARTRATQGPASALSATITLTGAAATGGDLVYTVNRNADPAAYTGSYTTNVLAKVGTFPLAVRFYGAADGAGSVVASGLAGVTIAKDGTGIGTVGVSNAVSSVVATGGQALVSGTSAQLAFTARDASGNLLAVSPGSGRWSQTAGAAYFSLTADGAVTTLASGSGTAQVTVDGVTSDAVGVSVIPSAVASVVIDPDQYNPVGVPRQLTMIAKDAQGNVIDVPSSTASWTLVDGTTLTLSPSGVVKSTGAGTAHVTATLGGVTSATTAIYTTTGPIKTVYVTPDQEIPIGQTKQLTLFAEDASGNVLSVPNGLATWRVYQADPDATVTSTGLATGIQTGTLNVIATVNGIDSDPTQIKVVKA